MKEKRVLSLIILLSMLFSLLSGFNFTVSADDDWDFWQGKIRGIVFIDDESEGYVHSGDARVQGIKVTVSGGGETRVDYTDARGEYYFMDLNPEASYTIEFESPFPLAPLEEGAKRFKPKTGSRPIEIHPDAEFATPAGSKQTATHTVNSLKWSDGGGSLRDGYEVVVIALMEEPYTIHFIPQPGDTTDDPIIEPTFTKAYQNEPIAEWPTVKVADDKKRQFIGWYVNDPNQWVSGVEGVPGSIGTLATGKYSECPGKCKYYCGPVCTHECKHDCKPTCPPECTHECHFSYVREITYNARVDTLVFDVTYKVAPYDIEYKGVSGSLRMHNSPPYENREPENYVYPGGPWLVEKVIGNENPSPTLWPDPDPDDNWYFWGWTEDAAPIREDDYGPVFENLASTDPLWPLAQVITTDRTFTAVFRRVPTTPVVLVTDLELYVGDDLMEHLTNPRLIDIDGKPIIFNDVLHRDITNVNMNVPGTYKVVYDVYTNVEENRARTIYNQRIKVHGKPVFTENPLPAITRVFGDPLTRADLIAGVTAKYERASDTIGAPTTLKDAIITTDSLTPRNIGEQDITIVAHVAEMPDYFERTTVTTRKVKIVGTPTISAVKSEMPKPNYPAGAHYNKGVEISAYSSTGLQLQWQKPNGSFEDFSGWLDIPLGANETIIKDYVFRYKEFASYTMNFPVALSNKLPVLEMDGAQPAADGKSVYTKKLQPVIKPGVDGDSVAVRIYKNGDPYAAYSGLTTLPALTKGTYRVELRDTFGNSSAYEFEVKALNVLYNANGADKYIADLPTDAKDYYYGEMVEAQHQNKLARSMYKFNGWNTKDNGSGTNYLVGASFAIYDNVELFANWADDTPTASIGGGGGGGNPGAKYDNVTIECKDETGRVVHTHTETQQAGTKVKIKAPELPGYRLVGDSEVEITVGDRNTKVAFEYVRDAIAIDPVVHAQYLKGYPDSSIGTDGHITRAEAATILYRLVNDPNKYAIIDSTFSDVEDTDWYAQAVAYLAKIKVISGYQDGTFKPNNVISRAEFAVIVARFNNLGLSNDKSFADVSDDFWGAQYINAVAQRGWIGGFPDGSFKPNESITRAQVASTVNRMLGRKTNLDSLPDSLKNMYWDLPITHWAYADMMEASVDHEFTIGSDGYEIWK